jgi:NADH-quinone oxidoreductase subunit E
MPQAGAGQQPRARKAMYLGDTLAEPPPPDLLEVLGLFHGRDDALVAVLQRIQGLYGYLPERSVRYAARELGIPLARIFGVATFYNQFRFTPPGKIRLQVCCGTACHVRGAPDILQRLKETLGVAADQTTLDNMFTLQTVFCVGGCSLAPVVLANGEAHGRMTPVGAEWLVRDLRAVETGEEAGGL